MISLTQSLWIRRIARVLGRLSVHQYQNIDVLMDVAHNAESVRALSSDFVRLRCLARRERSL